MYQTHSYTYIYISFNSKNIYGWLKEEEQAMPALISTTLEHLCPSTSRVVFLPFTNKWSGMGMASTDLCANRYTSVYPALAGPNFP